MIDEPKRPDPDELLGKIEKEQKQAARGKLKIFFGSSAGVGKTYAMLSSAHEKQRDGKKVLVGIVETHQRFETEELLSGLPLLKPVSIDYHGVLLHELNIDGALEGKPDILLVDELAHTNAPGSRHPKRWNDVMEILDAGIDVYTTLNVQHIESLSDLVAGATGVWVKETIPDSVFDSADEVVLVDIEADDLLKRLSEGKVYVAPQAKSRAAMNFFKKNNLIALRELALRRTAERVDAEIDFAWDGKGEKPLIADKILVCVGNDPLSAKLVRSAKRLATALKTPWTALYVENEDVAQLDEKKRANLQTLFRMVERMGGKTATMQGGVVADEIVAYARQNRFTKIIVGRPPKSAWKRLWKGYLVDSVVRKSGNIDIYVVTGDPFAAGDTREDLSWRSFLRPRPFLGALSVVIFGTFIGFLGKDILTPTDQALIYLTGVVFVGARFGVFSSLLYSLLSVFALNSFFIGMLGEHPESLGRQSYLMTFFVMIITGYVIARQASKLSFQVFSARERERHTNMLFTLTRELTSVRGRRNVCEAVAHHVGGLVASNVTVWMPDNEGDLEPLVGELAEENRMKELGALQWSFENARLSGRQTDTIPTALGLYFPLTVSRGTLGVLGVAPKKEGYVFSQDEVSTIETMANLLASALDRVVGAEAAERAHLETESRKLRDALLRSVSQNISSPLASISGAAGSLLSGQEKLSQEAVLNLAHAIDEETVRLSNIVGSFLEEARIEPGKKG